MIDLDKVGQAIDWFREVRAQGRSIFVCGNGGSFRSAPSRMALRLMLLE